MSEETKPPDSAASSGSGKKPYSPPSVISEPIYETLALACGKLPGQGAFCKGAPHRS
jgi:hypothetical protein